MRPFSPRNVASLLAVLGLVGLLDVNRSHVIAYFQSSNSEDFVASRLSALDLSTMPPEKVEAMKNTQVETLASFAPGPSYRNPIDDKGESAQIAILKNLIPALLTKDLKTGAMGPYTKDREQHIADAAGARRIVILNIWGSSFAPERLGIVETGVNQAAEDSMYSGFSDAKFEVIEWQGLQIDGDRAFGLALSHPSYSSNEQSWSSDRDRQLQIKLVKEGGTWKLAEKIEVEIPSN